MTKSPVGVLREKPTAKKKRTARPPGGPLLEFAASFLFFGRYSSRLVLAPLHGLHRRGGFLAGFVDGAVRPHDLGRGRGRARLGDGAALRSRILHDVEVGEGGRGE